MSHLKTLQAPRQWHIRRKEKKYIIRPAPGGHSKELALPLLVILRDILHLGRTAYELKKIMRMNDILIDGKKRTAPHLPVGVFDVISIPHSKAYYRMVIDLKGRIAPISISEHESSLKICKVLGKKAIVGGKTQITLNDGHTLLTDQK